MGQYLSYRVNIEAAARVEKITTNQISQRLWVQIPSMALFLVFFVKMGENVSLLENIFSSEDKYYLSWINNLPSKKNIVQIRYKFIPYG
jgi:hypothetical protein